MTQEERAAKRPLDNDVQQSRKKLKPTELSPMEALPAELFCQILTFVGSTSSTLIGLSEVNKHMNFTMNAIGRAMLPRARSNFRIPLEPKSPKESCTSLFLRHARTCSGVLNQLSQLRVRLNQDQMLNDVAIMDKTMEAALHLLEVGPTLSVSLERQILSTAGKCGGKAYKVSRTRMLEGLSAIPPDDGSLMSATTPQTRRNQERLDMARLIMQIVVFRDLQLSKQESPSNLTTTLVPVVKKTLSMGCI